MQQQPSSTAEQMEEQLEAVADLYRLVQSSCIAKCSGPPTEGYLRVREGVCLDRCVSKFFAASDVIAKAMQKYQDGMQRQTEAEQTLNSSGVRGYFGL